jgi:predicted dehydrogenase
VRVGLVGTGYWAREVHAAAVLADPELDLVGVWGRDPAKARAVANDVGASAHRDIDSLLEQVDALTFAVPPPVQAGIATRAAAAGKHLLLEKPIAVSQQDAAQLAEAVREAGVASVVFFTHRFLAAQRRWVEQAKDAGGWEHAWGTWFGAAFEPGSPFDTPWRHDKGALWDVGPHALSVLCGVLGGVTEVTAVPGPRGLVLLVLTHDTGAISTASLALSATADSARTGVTLWGPAGVSDMPTGDTPVVEALGTALRELRQQAGSPAPSHPCDVFFGRAVVDVLAEAERQLAARARPR